LSEYAEEPTYESAETAREFMHIGRLIPPGQQVVTIAPTDSVGTALQLMRELDYSQLPALHGGRVVGAFTWRCFANFAHVVPPAGVDPLQTPVEDWLDDLRYVRAREELSVVLPALTADGAVLVGDEDQLVAVVTLSDLADFLWAETEPFVLLQDVEIAIRDLLRAACPSDDALDKCIRDAAVKLRPGAKARGGLLSPDDLTFGGLTETRS
jgi:predicted transcriptional regulator